MADMVDSVSGWTRVVQIKLWDPLRTRAIPKRLRGVFTTRRYTNPRLPYLTLFYSHTHKRQFSHVFEVALLRVPSCTYINVCRLSSAVFKRLLRVITNDFCSPTTFKRLWLTWEYQYGTRVSHSPFCWQYWLVCPISRQHNSLLSLSGPCKQSLSPWPKAVTSCGADPNFLAIRPQATWLLSVLSERSTVTLRASSLSGQYPIIQLADKHTCVNSVLRVATWQ